MLVAVVGGVVVGGGSQRIDLIGILARVCWFDMVVRWWYNGGVVVRLRRIFTPRHCRGPAAAPPPDRGRPAVLLGRKEFRDEINR